MGVWEPPSCLKSLWRSASLVPATSQGYVSTARVTSIHPCLLARFTTYPRCYIRPCIAPGYPGLYHTPKVTSYPQSNTTHPVLQHVSSVISHSQGHNRLYFPPRVAFRDVLEDKLRPCVGLRTQGEEVVGNFGGQPFIGDVESLLAAYKGQVRRGQGAGEAGGQSCKGQVRRGAVRLLFQTLLPLALLPIMYSCRYRPPYPPPPPFTWPDNLWEFSSPGVRRLSLPSRARLCPSPAAGARLCSRSYCMTTCCTAAAPRPLPSSQETC